jgi:hypothetical protein
MSGTASFCSTVLMIYSHQFCIASESQAVIIAGPFPPKASRSGTWFKIALSALFGMIVGLAHHFFFRFLSGRAVNSIFIHRRVVDTQQWVSTFANALATIVATSFAYAISMVFVQQFWSGLREKPFSIRDITKLVASQNQALSGLSALSSPKWRLAFIAILSTIGMKSLSIFAPGALSVVQANFVIPQPCNISTVDLWKTDFSSIKYFAGSLPPIRSLANRVLMSGSYIPPPNTCGTCQYTTSFVAVAVKCTNITKSFNFPPSFTIPIDNNSPGNTFWNATYFTYATHNVTILQAAWKNDWFQSNDTTRAAIECIPYNTTYDVRVTQDAISTIDIMNMTYNHPLDFTDSINVDAVADAVFFLLNGTSTYSSITFQFTPDSNQVGNSPLGHFSNSLWQWNADLFNALPSLVQNVSISLLAGNLSVNRGYYSLVNTPATCNYSAIVFHYAHLRLLMTYGAGLLVTLACVIFSYSAVKANQCGQTLSFRRMVNVILNENLRDHLNQLTDDSFLHCVGGQLQYCPSDESHDIGDKGH